MYCAEERHGDHLLSSGLAVVCLLHLVLTGHSENSETLKLTSLSFPFSLLCLVPLACISKPQSHEKSNNAWNFLTNSNPDCNIYMCLFSQKSILRLWHCLATKLYSDFRNPRDCSLEARLVHGLFQTRILEWVLLSSRSSQPRA